MRGPVICRPVEVMEALCPRCSCVCRGVCVSSEKGSIFFVCDLNQMGTLINVKSHSSLPQTSLKALHLPWLQERQQLCLSVPPLLDVCI